MKTELTGYKYDQVKYFDQLRIAVKQIEHDHLKSKEMPVSKSATTDIGTTDIGVRKEIDDLKKMVSSLIDTVKDLSKQMQSPNNTQPRREILNIKEHNTHNRGDISTTLVQGMMEVFSMSTERTYAMAMPHTNGSLSFQLDNTYIKRQMIGQQSKRLNITNDMVGTTTESPATIEGVNTTTLIDTGSCVSTISRQFYQSHLNHLELQKCEDILNIECANGDKLPYDGFFEASFTVQGLPVKRQHAIFLIVPNSAYNQKVPILLGTNILQELMKTCKDTCGERYLLNSSLSTPWYIAFSCLNVRERNLEEE